MAKLVNVTCRRPIRLRNKLVRAIHREMLEAEEIFECIIQHGVVEEILEDGRTRILDFTNYNEEVVEEPKEEKEPTTKKSGKKETKSEPKEDKEPVTEPEVKPETETTPDETTEEDPKGPETKTEDVKENAEEKVAEAEEKAAKKSNKK